MDSEFTWALVRLAIFLPLVLFLAYWLTRTWLGRVKTPGMRRRGQLQVHERAHLGGRAYVAVVQVGEKNLLVGVSDQGVNLLAQLEDYHPAEEAAPEEPWRAWGRVLVERFGGRTGEKGGR